MFLIYSESIPSFLKISVLKRENTSPYYLGKNYNKFSSKTNEIGKLYIFIVTTSLIKN